MSVNAIANRTKYVDYLLDGIVKEVQTQIGSLPNASFSFALSSVDLMAINFKTSTQNTNVTCASYAIKTIGSTTGSTTTPTIPISTEPISTIDTTPKETDKSGFSTIKVVGGVLLVASAIALISSSKKSK